MFEATQVYQSGIADNSSLETKNFQPGESVEVRQASVCNTRFRDLERLDLAHSAQQRQSVVSNLRAIQANIACLREATESFQFDKICVGGARKVEVDSTNIVENPRSRRSQKLPEPVWCSGIV